MPLGGLQVFAHVLPDGRIGVCSVDTTSGDVAGGLWCLWRVSDVDAIRQEE